nr:hypothetical protein [Pedobacter panaciterrae]
MFGKNDESIKKGNAMTFIKRILFLLGIFISGASSAQTTSYQLVNRFCDCPEFEFRNGFKLKDIKQSSNDFEIRLHAIRTGAYYTIFVLSKKKNIYDAKLYVKKIEMISSGVNWPDSVKNIEKWEKYPFRKFEVVHMNLDSVFREFKEHHIFSLPSQNTIIKNRGFATPYKIETKTEDQVNEFRFGSPSEFTNELSKFQELRDYKAILDLFIIITLRYNSQYYAILHGE